MIALSNTVKTDLGERRPRQHVEPHPSPDLAVVIPAFKARFLEETLKSLAAQSDPNFRVIVADDGSPDDIRAVSAKFSELLRLTYIRFETTLGARELTAHWTRAVERAESEWIWLIGDDDALEPEAMAHMRRAIAADPCWTGLWRAEIDIIDADGIRCGGNPRSPPAQSSRDYVRARWAGHQQSYACEHVFRKAVWKQRGGFVSFPLAWCSDDATWVTLAGAAGFRTVKGQSARALWRRSAINISGGAASLLPQKMDAMLKYLAWIGQTGHAIGGDAVSDQENRRLLAQDGYAWFMRRLERTQHVLGFRDSWAVCRELSGLCGRRWSQCAIDLLRLQLSLRWRLLRAPLPSMRLQ